MTFPMFINPVCGHSIMALHTIPGTTTEVCVRCQDELAAHLILTLEAQTENKEVHVISSEAQG